MKIALEPYSLNWKLQFGIEKATIASTLSGVAITIEHIGSTAIEGLIAKPVIDILIGLDDFKLANNQINKLTSIGYEYIDKYEDLLPYRRFFVKECNRTRTHHIHMVEINSEFWIRHLAFRNYLITHEEDRMKYHQLKLKLSAIDWKDGNEYANAKTEFIRGIEKKAIR